MNSVYSAGVFTRRAAHLSVFLVCFCPLLSEFSGPFVVRLAPFVSGTSQAACFAASPTNAAPNNWSQWRGPARDSHLPDASAWPDSLHGMKETWKIELGPGYSGPIVWNDFVFATETVDKKREVVRALNRKTGEEVWRAGWDGAMTVPFFARSNGDWIRSTPACDGQSIYVGGMRDVLVCLDIQDGTRKWHVDFTQENGSELPAFGFVSSPLVVGKHVYVQAGGGFAKLDKRTGQVLWTTLADGGGMSGSAFSSPVLATLAGKQQVVVQTRQLLCGVDPVNGDVLWKQEVPSFRGMNILTPTVFRDGVFTSTHKSNSFFYRVEKDADQFRVAEVWKNAAKGYMSSPVLIDNYVYQHLGNGRFCCIDLRTGNETWRTESFGKYWSMVANGTRVLALDERGEILLINCQPDEFRLLDRQSVSDRECWAHLAVSGRDVFVRDLASVRMLRWSDAP